MPARPNQIYTHDGWQGYGGWLGTGTVTNKDQQFLPFEKALLYARSLKRKNAKEWATWCKTGHGQPLFPLLRSESTSTTGGTGGDTGWVPVRRSYTVAPKNQTFLPFKKALVYALSLKLKNLIEWHAWCKSGVRPANKYAFAPKPSLHAQRVAKMRALAGHWHSCTTEPQIPAVQDGAGMRTRTQAENP